MMILKVGFITNDLKESITAYTAMEILFQYDQRCLRSQRFLFFARALK